MCCFHSVFYFVCISTFCATTQGIKAKETETEKILIIYAFGGKETIKKHKTMFPLGSFFMLNKNIYLFIVSKNKFLNNFCVFLVS